MSSIEISFQCGQTAVRIAPAAPIIERPLRYRSAGCTSLAASGIRLLVQKPPVCFHAHRRRRSVLPCKFAAVWKVRADKRHRRRVRQTIETSFNVFAQRPSIPAAWAAAKASKSATAVVAAGSVKRSKMPTSPLLGTVAVDRLIVQLIGQHQRQIFPKDRLKSWLVRQRQRPRFGLRAGR